MKLSKMKKIISGTVSAVMIAASVPLSANAGGFNFGGDNGGMTWGGWGNNGGGQDWSGFAGGFETNGNTNIGSDAGNGGNAQSGLNSQIKGDHLELTIDDKVLVLNPGDSIHFDGSRPHCMRALNDEPVNFICVII